MKIQTLLEYVATVSGSCDGNTWHPTRPQTAENTFILLRIRAAWRVLIGKSDAVEWINIVPMTENPAQPCRRDAKANG